MAERIIHPTYGVEAFLNANGMITLKQDNFNDEASLVIITIGRMRY